MFDWIVIILKIYFFNKLNFPFPKGLIVFVYRMSSQPFQTFYANYEKVFTHKLSIQRTKEVPRPC